MSIPLPTIDHPQRKQILERNLKRLKRNKLEYHNKLVDIEIIERELESCRTKQN